MASPRLPEMPGVHLSVPSFDFSIGAQIRCQVERIQSIQSPAIGTIHMQQSSKLNEKPTAQVCFLCEDEVDPIAATISDAAHYNLHYQY